MATENQTGQYNAGHAHSGVIEAAGDTLGTVREAVGDAVADAARAAVETGGGITDTLSGAVDSAQDMAGSAVKSTKKIVGNAGDAARGTGSSIVSTVKKNPVPSALIGVGAAWLLWSTRAARDGGSKYPAHGGDIQLEPGITDRAMDSVGAAADAVQGKASEVTSRATGAMHGTKQTVTRAISANPMGAVAVAAGIGAAVGLLIPESARENELMGEAKVNLVHQAEQTAEDLTDKVKEVARHAAVDAVSSVIESV